MPDDTAKTHVFLKAIVFIALFLALYTTLIALIPTEFYSASAPIGSTYDFSFLSLEDMRHIRFIKENNLTRPAVFHNHAWFDFTQNITYKMRATWTSTSASDFPNQIFFEHETWEFLFFSPIFDAMRIENVTIHLGQYPLTKQFAISKWSNTYNASIFSPVQCDHVRTKVWIFDQNSTRNNISAAWDDGALRISMGFGYDDTFAKQSSLDVLGRILLFQAPTVYELTGDMATVVNLILTIPFYAMVGVLIFLVIIAILPF